MYEVLHWFTILGDRNVLKDFSYSGSCLSNQPLCWGLTNPGSFTGEKLT